MYCNANSKSVSHREKGLLSAPIRRVRRVFHIEKIGLSFNLPNRRVFHIEKKAYSQRQIEEFHMEKIGLLSTPIRRVFHIEKKACFQLQIEEKFLVFPSRNRPVATPKESQEAYSQRQISHRENRPVATPIRRVSHREKGLLSTPIRREVSHRENRPVATPNRRVFHIEKIGLLSTPNRRVFHIEKKAYSQRQFEEFHIEKIGLLQPQIKEFHIEKKACFQLQIEVFHIEKKAYSQRQCFTSRKRPAFNSKSKRSSLFSHRENRPVATPIRRVEEKSKSFTSRK